MYSPYIYFLHYLYVFIFLEKKILHKLYHSQNKLNSIFTYLINEISYYTCYYFFFYIKHYIYHFISANKKHLTRIIYKNTSLTHYKTDRINLYAFHFQQMRRFHLSPRYYFSTSISAYERYT